MPEDVGKLYPAEHRDVDGQFASWRVWLTIIAYNTNLVKAEDAPKSFADLLDPKWKGKIVKAHPGYSGTIMTATYQMQRDLGWSWFEQLAKQNIMQVQSSADPPKKLDLGERAVMADGNEYNIFQMKEKGRPVEPVYATEGSPLIIGPNGIFKDSPNPNAAKLFQSFCFSRDAQQLIIDVGGLRSVHPQTQEKPGRKPFKDIKTMKDDAAAVEKEGDCDQGALYQDLPRLTRRSSRHHDIPIAKNVRRRNAGRQDRYAAAGHAAGGDHAQMRGPADRYRRPLRHRAQRGLCRKRAFRAGTMTARAP